MVVEKDRGKSYTSMVGSCMPTDSKIYEEKLHIRRKAIHRFFVFTKAKMY